jgi:hypothetical protein
MSICLRIYNQSSPCCQAPSWFALFRVPALFQEMHLLPFLLVLLYGAAPSHAREVKESEICVEAISEALATLSFYGNLSICTNRLRTYSIYATIKLYCTEREIEPGLEYINKNCQGALSRLPYEDVEPELTNAFLRSLRVVDFQEVPSTEVLDTAVLISGSYFKAAYRTIVSGVSSSSIPFFLPFRISLREKFDHIYSNARKHGPWK